MNSSAPDKSPFGHDQLISYSRKDLQFAQLLERALANYSPPKGLGVRAHRLAPDQRRAFSVAGRARSRGVGRGSLPAGARLGARTRRALLGTPNGLELVTGSLTDS
jgi:hypothetical protein